MKFIKAVIKNETVTRDAWMCPHCGNVYPRRVKCCEHIENEH